MRKEIVGILLFFLVVLTLISLLSYSPTDPSINNATSAGHIHNFFGLFGAHMAGILIGLFGLGATVRPGCILDPDFTPSYQYPLFSKPSCQGNCFYNYRWNSPNYNHGKSAGNKS
ncbi:MAG: DNA translocase FtsK 4TM domain-containing protein [Deltaproteobacteria bacterium]|nr:DNA translocase FtsK 4TM domain-containing protein [Deltaproteobacteria bacterium]